MNDRTSPADPGRRALIKGLGLAAAATPLALASPVAVANVADAPLDRAASSEDRVPWRGPHQAGIVTPRPEHGLFAAFDVVADTPDEIADLFARLTDRVAFLTEGGAVPERGEKLPPADSCIVGPEVRPDALTVTVSLGDAFFETRDFLRPLKPRRLQRMTSFPNDALDADRCHGELGLQFCANSADTAIHALRDVVRNLGDRLLLKWMQEGSVPAEKAPAGGGRAGSARNYLGFRDGTANPDAGDGSLMDEIVWVGEGAGEPVWTRGGSYQAVRIIRNFVERWDRAPLGEQQRIFGRAKVSGAPLDRPHGHEFDVPDYASDPDGARTPLSAHIRRANPRDGRRDYLILRRPFNYSNGVAKNGQLDQGLLFIAYQADLEKGFVAVQRMLDGEPLEEYVKPVGGGYFFALPGAPEGGRLGDGLMAEIRRL